MPWKTIYELIGPGMYWTKPRQLFLDAIKEAEQMNKPDVVKYLKTILELRDQVFLDKPKDH